MLTISIRTGNAAVLHPEDIAELIEQAADRVRQGRKQAAIMDYNGNRVGELSWTEDKQGE